MRIQVQGVEKALSNFDRLPAKMQFLQMRIALNAGAGVIRDRAASIVPQDSRLLRRSLNVKVRIPNESLNPKHWGKPEYAVIGATRRFSGAVTLTATGKTKILASRAAVGKAALKGATIRRRIPSRYLHLVEKGTVHSIAQPFLDTAVRTEGPLAQLKMIRKLEQGLYKEAARLYAGS